MIREQKETEKERGAFSISLHSMNRHNRQTYSHAFFNLFFETSSGSQVALVSQLSLGVCSVFKLQRVIHTVG